jgi:hypothetical protein
MKLLWPNPSSSTEAAALCWDHLAADIDFEGPDSTTRCGADPFAVGLLVVSIPNALLATWDLAERLRLLHRVEVWLAALRALPGAAQAHFELSSGPRYVADLSAADLLVEAQHEALTGSPGDYAWDTFIIHGSGDRVAARSVWETLVRQNISSFLDKASLRPGDDWPRRLLEGLQRTQVFVVIVGPGAAKAWYNHDELARAVQLTREDPRRALIPVLFDGATMDDLPYGLGQIVPAHPEEVVDAVRAKLRA